MANPESVEYLKNNFEIKSKTYCPPSKRDKSLYVVVNIAIIFVVIFSIVSMLVKGVKVGNVSGCIVAIVVGYLLKSNNRKDGHYEFCVLSIVFREDFLTVTFLPSKNKEIVIALDSVKTLEYSDKLECLRIICSYEERVGSDRRNESSELLLYIPYTTNLDFYQTLERNVALPLKFVDRQ